MHTPGLGNPNAKIHIYCQNTPPIEPYLSQITIRGVESDEIGRIGQLTGNHWRKIFNVLAKFAFQRDTDLSKQFKTWQTFRDTALLSVSGDYALWFGLQNLETSQHHVSIVMGKQYGETLGLAEKCFWLSPSFAINEELRVIICPYFDYRQLSNIKIEQLCNLVTQMMPKAKTTLKTNTYLKR